MSGSGPHPDNIHFISNRTAVKTARPMAIAIAETTIKRRNVPGWRTVRYTIGKLTSALAAEARTVQIAALRGEI